MDKQQSDYPLLEEQKQQEIEMYRLALERYDHNLESDVAHNKLGETREGTVLIKVSIDKLTEYLDTYIKTTYRGNNKKVQALFIRYFPETRDLAFSLIKSALSTIVTLNGSKDRKGTGSKLLHCSRMMGRSLRDIVRAEELRRVNPDLYGISESSFKAISEKQVNLRKIKTAKMLKLGEIPRDVLLLFGVTALDLVAKSGINLIYIAKEGDSNVVRLTDEATALILQGRNFYSQLLMSYKPLICPPKPWDSITGSGGYYTYSNIDFIKFKSIRDKKEVYKNKLDLSRLFQVVNGIQNVPFRINQRVLETVEYIIENNLTNPDKSIYSPELYGEVPYMETLDSKTMHPKEAYGMLNETTKQFINHDDKKRWAKALTKQDKLNEITISKRLQFSLALGVARDYKKYEKFYYSYTTDFRSRIYPVQNFLNPQSSGNIKPLVEFADGCVLNDEGVRWLKIHGANCYGFDKLPYEGRINEIDKRVEEIKAIHSDPIGNIRYWYDCDSPLLYLAFCIAYGDYLSDPSLPCHCPVYLDATCSGIQIYSGLLKDHEGALAVNVVNNPLGKPNDIYNDVAKVVEDLIDLGEYPKMIAYTDKLTDEVMNDSTYEEVRSIKGKMTRKLTKRNVMTTPYSVTRRGMFEQVLELLKEYEADNKQFWKGQRWVVAKLISDMNARAIGIVVKGATIGQEVIKETLQVAMGNGKRFARWNTPMFNFPVLQYINKEKKSLLYSPLGRLIIYKPSRDINKQRMMNGIAPNFIHSLDATLLYRTVELCQERGYNEFLLIHDSFAMLPNSIPTMNVAVREAYKELFESNPLESWVEQVEPECLEKAKDAMINTLNLEQVLESEYIFS